MAQNRGCIVESRRNSPVRVSRSVLNCIYTSLPVGEVGDAPETTIKIMSTATGSAQKQNTVLHELGVTVG